MEFKRTLTSPNPSSGEVLELLRKKVEEGDIGEIKKKVKTLEEQKKVAEDRLNFFLNSISDTPGARKVVERFYEEQHGKEIDASDSRVLEKEVPDIDSVLHKNKLPIVSKSDLRNHFGVDGAWEGEKVEDKDYLVPKWVEDHEEEPYGVIKTSGTTDKPWGRAVTRNDWAVWLLSTLRQVSEFLEENNVRPEEVNAVVISPSEKYIVATEEILESLNITVKIGDFEKLRSGGNVAKRESESIIEHVNSGEYGMVFSPLEMIMRGKLGVEFRRGNFDADLLFNAGQPLPEEKKRELEEQAFVQDIYGETEYPQGGAREVEVKGVSGFSLPFESQINLIYDKETEELSYEGRGRFAYLPFGSEGQIIPGVYVTGIRGTIRLIDGRYQLLQDIERIDDPNRGCYEAL